MYRLLFGLWLIFMHSPIIGQDNLIPNPSFESYTDIPDQWYFKGQHFTEIVRYWVSPTPASPDAYSPKIKVPDDWKNKGFGNIKAYDGNNMVGLTIYGCNSGKPHCREYIQVRLTEALVPNQKYTLSFWVAQLEGSIAVNNFGFHFSKDDIVHPLDTRMEAVPQILLDTIIQIPKNQWREYQLDYTAQDAYEVLTIGNFQEDSQTHSSNASLSKLNFAYVYLDLISLRKAEPILPVPDRQLVLKNLKLEKGQLFTLDNIYFDLDKTDFLLASFEQLNSLVYLLQQNRSVHIDVIGHTDNQGNDQYNQELSESRAQAVVEYLISKGIAANRLSYRGNGSSQPLADNETPEGRRTNRRVEFEVLK